MEHSRRKLGSSLGGCAIAAALVAGCASTGQVADQVVKSNLAQESAQNQLLLLNIVRAYHRRPMHFTQISAIRLPVGIGNPSFTIPTPFGPDFSQQIYNVSTSIAVQQGVDTTVLNSQEFTRGITTPMPPSLLLYYLDQGWPQQMVLHLFVRKVEIYKGKELVRGYINYPENPKAFAAFSAVMADLRGCEFEAKSLDGKAYGPEYTPGQLLDIKGLAAAKGVELSLEPRGADLTKPTGYQFVKPNKNVELSMESSGRPCQLPDGATKVSAAATPEREKGTSGNEMSATFVLRSPEAMLYYLGEIARAQLDGNSQGPQFLYSPVRVETFDTDRATLFSLKRGATAEAAVSVEYEGVTYSVPKGSAADRSMHVLSLVTQVMGLQNKGTDLPSTANVRIVQ